MPATNAPRILRMRIATDNHTKSKGDLRAEINIYRGLH